ncbi:MAG: TIGR03118 family protein [Gemmatimonadales bacterium]
MQHRAARAGRSTIAALAIASFLAACGDSITNNVPSVNSFNETKLVADNAAGGAATVDANLVNPWGLAFSSTGILWASDNGTGVSTLYKADGTALPTIFRVAGIGNGGTGTPTGVIFNSSTSFVIPGFGPSAFIFANIDGTIAASNPTAGRALIVADRSAATAEYTGIAMATNAGASFVYAANFRHNQIDMFDASFKFLRSFTDSTMAADFAPFGIATINGQLWVTFAKQSGGPGSTQDEPGIGNGFVDVFNPDGSRARRFAANGQLDSPWGVVQAPTGFGSFGGDILVGNFGNGKIGVYNPTTGAFIANLRDANNADVTIDGLWGLAFGPATDSTTLYFAAGINDERDGLLGTITAR